jgi:hypothetical protein
MGGQKQGAQGAHGLCACGEGREGMSVRGGGVDVGMEGRHVRTPSEFGRRAERGVRIENGGGVGKVPGKWRDLRVEGAGGGRGLGPLATGPSLQRDGGAGGFGAAR